jgi:hypothetical protein
VDIAGDAAALLRHLEQVEWPALSIALALHLAKRAARARAWQNVVCAAYPRARLPYLPALGACVAAVGVSAVAPVRGCEALRVVLVKPRIEGSSYPTLTATLVVEAAVDVVISGTLAAVALGLGLVPGLGGLAAVGIGHERLGALWDRLRLGLAILGDRRGLLCGVVSWIVLSWALRLASIYAFLLAFSLEAGPGTAVLVVVVQCLSALIPLSWAGIGAQHGLLVVALGSSAGTAGAVAFGLGMQAATLLVNVGAGAVALTLTARTLRWRSLLRACA